MERIEKAVLRALADGPARTGELARRAGVTPSTATRVLLALEHQRRVKTWAFTVNFGDRVVKRMWALPAPDGDAKAIARIQEEKGQYFCLCVRHANAARRPNVDQAVRVRQKRRDVCFVCGATASYEYFPNLWPAIERARADRRPTLSQAEVERRLAKIPQPRRWQRRSGP